jgi:hypothetical protein
MPCCEHEAGPDETRTRSPEEWLEYSSRNAVCCSTVHKTYRPTQKPLQSCSATRTAHERARQLNSTPAPGEYR